MLRSLQARLVGLIVALTLVLSALAPDIARAQSSCPSSAYTGGVIATGTRVRIVGLSVADAYYSSSSGIIGKTGVVDQLDPTGDYTGSCWHGGQFYGDDGSSFYFYQVAVELLSAAGASCPGGAATSNMSDGTRVKILGVHPEDAYYPSAASMIGLTGVVSGDLHSNDGCWMGGGFTADNGTYYYFYKAAVQNLGGGGSAVACPYAAYSGATLTSGTRVRVLTVSPSDAYYSSKYTVEGKLGRVDGTWSKMGEPCWFAGQFYGDDGSSFYFYQAAVEILTAAPTTMCPPGASTSGMAGGTRVKILGLHAEDLYYPDSATMIGLTGTVTGDLHSNDGCWMGGGFTADNGTYYYFYKAAVQDLGGTSPPVTAGGSCPAASYTGAVPTSGTRIRVLTVSPSDAYYSSRYDYGLEGKVGRVDTGWSKTGEPCWYAGQFYGDDGSSYYFYQAAIEILGASTGSTGGAGDRYMASAMSMGQRFRIVAIHPDDVYYATRADLVGKHCTASETMNSAASGWYSGAVKCTDGSEYYFYKVGVVLE